MRCSYHVICLMNALVPKNIIHWIWSMILNNWQGFCLYCRGRKYSINVEIGYEKTITHYCNNLFKSILKNYFAPTIVGRLIYYDWLKIIPLSNLWIHSQRLAKLKILRTANLPLIVLKFKMYADNPRKVVFNFSILESHHHF